MSIEEQMAQAQARNKARGYEPKKTKYRYKPPSSVKVIPFDLVQAQAAEYRKKRQS